MAFKEIELPGIGTAKLYKKRGNNNIRMSYARDGSLRISLPYWLPYEAGVSFARERQDWILQNRPEPVAIMLAGSRVGKAHRLEFYQDRTKHKPSVRLRQGTVTVSMPAGMESSHQAAQAAAQRGAIKALKKEAERLLPQRLKLLAGKHGFSFGNVRIKRLSSRWGSCDQKRDITLNLFLMQLPWDLIDYVLVHELVHTEHLNHGDGFWSRFERALPDARLRRKQLKAYKTTIAVL